MEKIQKRETEDVAKKFAACVEQLRFEEAFSLLDDNGRYVVIGTTPVSRVYHGRQDLLDNLIPALSSFKEPPQVRFNEIVIDGNRAVLLGSGSGVGPMGRYDQPYYAFVLKVEGGKCSEIIEFLDTQMLHSALYGNS